MRLNVSAREPAQLPDRPEQLMASENSHLFWQELKRFVVIIPGLTREGMLLVANDHRHIVTICKNSGISTIYSGKDQMVKKHSTGELIWVL